MRLFPAGNYTSGYKPEVPAGYSAYGGLARINQVRRTPRRPCVRSSWFTRVHLAVHARRHRMMSAHSRYPDPDAAISRRARHAAPRGRTDEVIAEVIRECTAIGVIDELRGALGTEECDEAGAALRALRDVVYELAGAPNRDLAVDVLIYATGVAEFDLTSLRDYARKHGLTPEGFRQHVLKLQRRLGLPPRAMQHSDAN